MERLLIKNFTYSLQQLLKANNSLSLMYCEFVRWAASVIIDIKNQLRAGSFAYLIVPTLSNTALILTFVRVF